MNKHIGSDFDDFLDEDGLREEAMAAAVKRVIRKEKMSALAQFAGCAIAAISAARRAM